MAKDLFVSALLDVYGYALSERQRKAADLYYNEDLSLGEISENEGITRQGALDLINRARNQLYSFEEKCGYCKKFIRLQQLSSKAKNKDSESISEILEIIDSLYGV